MTLHWAGCHYAVLESMTRPRIQTLTYDEPCM